MAATTGAPTIEDYFFADDGVVPNNPRLPLIVYRGALETDGDAAARCVALFDRNGWTGAWKNGVYAHHHYHSSAHEVLGVAAGWVRVRLGGEGGQTVELRAGDVVVIPAGVAHKNEGASPDLLVVGAYPRARYAQSWWHGSRPHLAADRSGSAARRRPGPCQFGAADRALARRRTRLTGGLPPLLPAR